MRRSARTVTPSFRAEFETLNGLTLLTISRSFLWLAMFSVASKVNAVADGFSRLAERSLSLLVGTEDGKYLSPLFDEYRSVQ
jgi:hypothetical protein